MFIENGRCGIIEKIQKLRKSLAKVDADIVTLGAFYLRVCGTYVFFEFHVVNYRPVLRNGASETFYPSSTTMLALCVLPTAMLQFHRRIQRRKSESS